MLKSHTIVDMFDVEVSYIAEPSRFEVVHVEPNKSKSEFHYDRRGDVIYPVLTIVDTETDDEHVVTLEVELTKSTIGMLGIDLIDVQFENVPQEIADMIKIRVERG